MALEGRRRAGGAWLFTVGKEEASARVLPMWKPHSLSPAWVTLQGELTVCWHNWILSKAHYYSSTGAGVLAGALTTQVVLVGSPQSFPSCFKNSDVSGGKSSMDLKKKGSYSVEIPAVEFGMFLMSYSRWGCCCCQFWLVELLTWGTASSFENGKMMLKKHSVENWERKN